MDTVPEPRTLREGFWDRLGVDDAGMPVHLPMGVTANNEGPTNDSEAHHWVCWCNDPQCPLNRALLAAHPAAPEQSGPTGQGLETVIAGVLGSHVSRLSWSQGQPNGEWNAECLTDHWSVYGFNGGGEKAHAAFRRHLTDALAAAVRAAIRRTTEEETHG